MFGINFARIKLALSKDNQHTIVKLYMCEARNTIIHTHMTWTENVHIEKQLGCVKEVKKKANKNFLQTQKHTSHGISFHMFIWPNLTLIFVAVSKTSRQRTRNTSQL